MLFSICSSTNCPGQHYTYLLFLHSGFTCIPYLHSGLHALIINVTLCTWVRDIQLSNMWSTMKLNISVWECHCLNNTCINSQMCVCASSCTNESLLLCKARLYCKCKTILHQGIKQECFVAIFVLFVFVLCVYVCVCWCFFNNKKFMDTANSCKKGPEKLYTAMHTDDHKLHRQDTVLKVCGVIIKTNC